MLHANCSSLEAKTACKLNPLRRISLPATASRRTARFRATQPQIRPNIANIGGARARPAAASAQTSSLDDIITTMVNAGEGVSDLLFVVGRLPQVEMYGKLTGRGDRGPDAAAQPARMSRRSPSRSSAATSGWPAT